MIIPILQIKAQRHRSDKYLSGEEQLVNSSEEIDNMI